MGGKRSPHLPQLESRGVSENGANHLLGQVRTRQHLSQLLQFEISQASPDTLEEIGLATRASIGSAVHRQVPFIRPSTTFVPSPPERRATTRPVQLGQLLRRYTEDSVVCSTIDRSWTT